MSKQFRKRKQPVWFENREDDDARERLTGDKDLNDEDTVNIAKSTGAEVKPDSDGDWT